MGFCYNDGCLEAAEQRCSNCKEVTYCGVACQKEAWSHHKYECEMKRICREAQEGKEDQSPRERPPTTHCTGCNIKYDDEGDMPDSECPDCGYSACENCAVDHSQGSCWCQNSNFGIPYCEMEPAWYHMSSRTGKAYRGDRHPYFDTRDADAFEDKARICGNCGEMQRCLK